MHIPSRIIRLAKDRALSSFSTLAEQTVVEADTLTTRAMGGASGAELRDLNIVRGFLRGEARTLRTRMDRHFASLLDRAMVTMHAQTRAAAQEIDYEHLTLIDDDVVTRQIEIDRMVGRLREAEMVALGRVNLTIAIMHNDRDARERENPFRPYLLARALYEGLRELMWEESQSKLLFDALGIAMAHRLPGFYAGILEVFEAGGITARLTARPSAMSKAERDKMAWQRAAQLLVGSVDPTQLAAGHPDQALQERLVPKLERLKEIQLGIGGGGVASKQPDLLDTVWNVFHKQKGTPTPVRPEPGAERTDIDTALLEMQQEIGAGAEPPAPLALRGLLGEALSDPEHSRILDIVALLFESIVHDDLLPESMQRQLARLFVPFSRAALQQPDLLHDAVHPTRRLLDRLGSVGAGMTPATAGEGALAPEIESIVTAVLDLLDDDMAIFSDAEQALDSHVASTLSAGDERIAARLEAVAEAERDSALLANTVAALSAALQPLHIDPRVADFILGTWARVLSHPGSAADAAVALLPELLWSAQAKTTPEGHAAMMRMLPELVRRVRAGMASISLPETPSKAAFDRLVAVHMDVLGNKLERGRRHMSLDQFREHFQDFAVAPVSIGAGGDGWVGKFELEGALARRGVGATLHTKAAARMKQSSDAEWLSWAHPGTAFEVKIEGRYRAALLCAVSEGQGAFLFSVAEEKEPAIYLKAPLLEAMETSNLRPLEPAPLFDRAVESLMAGAESLASGPKDSGAMAGAR